MTLPSEWLPAPFVPPGDFRSFMAHFPTGVAVVSAIGADGQPKGMTCSSICSVALTPPTLLMCMRLGSPTLSAIVHSGSFAVNLLHCGAEATAALFASGFGKRFSVVDWNMDSEYGGPHLSDGVNAVADCKLSLAEIVGDHMVVFGETVHVSLQTEESPLLYGLRQYAAWPVEPA